MVERARVRKLLVGVLMAFSASIATRPAMAVVIMPAGDSLTAGYPGNAGTMGAPYPGYRKFLYEKLGADGVSVKYVGRDYFFDNNPQYPNITPDDPEWFTWGNATEDMNRFYESAAGPAALASKITADVTKLAPDIILYEHGINETSAGTSPADAAAHVKAVIDLMFTARPCVAIILSNYPSPAGAAVELNSNLAKIKAQEPGKNLTFVDMTQGFNPAQFPTNNDGGNPHVSPEGDSTDGTHPNIGGYMKLADKWYAAIKTVLPTVQCTSGGGGGAGGAGGGGSPAGGSGGSTLGTGGTATGSGGAAASNGGSPNVGIGGASGSPNTTSQAGALATAGSTGSTSAGSGPTDMGGSSSGCSCTVPRSQAGHASWLLMAGLSVLGLRRRRVTARRQTS